MFEKILIATDGSECSNRAAQSGIDLWRSVKEEGARATEHVEEKVVRNSKIPVFIIP